MAAGSSGIYELAGAISASEEAIEKDVCLKKKCWGGGRRQKINIQPEKSCQYVTQTL